VHFSPKCDVCRVSGIVAGIQFLDGVDFLVRANVSVGHVCYKDVLRFALKWESVHFLVDF
jgi:hypothetical protein